MNAMTRRMFELVEPIGAIPCTADEPNETMLRWDSPTIGHLLRRPGRSLGLFNAGVVDAHFYNFAPGEVARHILKVWRTTTPEAAIATRQICCVNALRRILCDRVNSSAFARATELLVKAVARFFYAGALLREHRADGHIAALMTEGVGGLEAHVLYAVDIGLPAEKFGRIHHLPAAQIAAAIDGMRDRGLIGDDGWAERTGSRRQTTSRSVYRRPRGEAL